jgi:hypothetical protein
MANGNWQLAIGLGMVVSSSMDRPESLSSFWDLNKQAMSNKRHLVESCFYGIPANCQLLFANHGQGKNGYNSKDRQDEQETQVLHPAPQPLQHMRPAARLPAQVRPLPPVFPRAGAEG